MKKLGKLVFIISIGSFALFARFFLFEVFILKSKSMIPNLQENDFIFVNKLAYGLREPFSEKYLGDVSYPKLGDPILFNSRRESASPFLKRVVALAGDEVMYRGGKLFVNGKARSKETSSFLRSKYKGMKDKLPGDTDYYIVSKEERGTKSYDVLSYEYGERKAFGPIKLEEGEIFVLGDFRPVSRDSRFFGLIHMNQVIGKAERVLFSCGKTWDRFPMFCIPTEASWDRLFTNIP